MAEDDGETRTNKEGREMDQEGRYKQKMTADEVYDVFDTVRGPVITAGDVADAFDTSTETARRRLRELYNDDRVEQRETRKRVLWWRTGDGDAVDLLMGNDPETLLKMVSREINDAITVGDTVYENGDTHSVSES
jgi:predicted ArsR family transcriptional regulator